MTKNHPLVLARTLRTWPVGDPAGYNGAGGGRMWLWAWLVGCGTESTPGIEPTNPTGSPTEEPTGTSPTSEPPEPGTSAATTWHRDVRPLVDLHCSGCHVAGGIAPFTFDDPAELDILGPGLVHAVETRAMPPFSFQPGCREIEDDLRLDEATIAVFTAWKDKGYPIGDEADYAAPTVSDPPPTPPHDLEAFPIRPFVPNLQQPDDYLCLVSDLPIEEDTFVTWARAVPDRQELVHHIIAYAVPPERLDELADLAGGDLEGQFPCWESPVVFLGPTIGGWVPGAEPTFEAGKDATRIPAGSKIVLEIHYNTLTAGGLSSATDNSSLRLWTIPEEEVENLLVLWTAYDYELDIPAGDPEVTEQLNVRLPMDAPIVSSNPHMHLLGTKLHSQVRYADGAEQCVSDVAWDFDWQWDYDLPEGQDIPFSSSAGDSVDLTCVFDNSAENQPIVDGVRQEPRDVEWGDGSLAEMCIDFYTFKVPYDPTASRGLCGGFDKCYQACPPDDPECPLVCMGMAGEACYSCGVEAMVGPCTALRCARESVSYLACLLACEDLETDFFGCQVEECAASLADYQACAQPLFANGTCARDYEACSGLVP